MKAFHYFFLIFCIGLFSCSFNKENKLKSGFKKSIERTNQYITVLGVAQDAGFPQIYCEKDCCKAYYNGTEPKKLVSCLGLVDMETKEKWLFDATPDMTQQTQILKTEHLDNKKVIDGVFLTHAHIGHYTGLMYLGFEAMGAKEIPVYAMPRMKSYLETNGPWSQLITKKNISLKLLIRDSTIQINRNLKVTPFLVPHRDEYSETVGYKIEGKQKSVLFIPDINKWKLWKRNIVDEVKKVDYAFVDATFLQDGEIARPMKDIPHPFIIETVKLFKNQTTETKSKIYFIHLNHTNPALKKVHKLKDSIQNLGYHFAQEGTNFSLN